MVRVIGHTLEELDQLSEEFESRVEDALEFTLKTALPALAIEPLVASLVAAAGDSLDDLSSISYTWNDQVDDLSTIIGGVYEGGALAIGYDVVGHLDLAPGEGIPALTDDFALTYLKGASNRLSGVGEVLWQNVRAELLAGYQAGESTDQLALRVQAALGSTLSRAKTIARTEVVAASNAGSLAQLQFVGLEAKKEWVSTHDARTRPSHILANGQTVGLDAAFIVGGSTLRFPGDPGGAAGQVINCRCTLAYEFPEESEAEFTCLATPDNILTAGVVPAPQGCMCPQPGVVDHGITDVTLSPDEQKALYALFKGKPISPAYGGAAIFKRIQEIQQSYPGLTPFQILKIVDSFYAAEKKKVNDHGFELKFNEWLGTAAGKKATGGLTLPTAPAVTPSVPIGNEMSMSKIVKEWQNGLHAPGDVIADGTTASGGQFRAISMGTHIRVEYFDPTTGKWDVEVDNIKTVSDFIDKTPVGVKWTEGTGSTNVAPVSPPLSTPQPPSGTSTTVTPSPPVTPIVTPAQMPPVGQPSGADIITFYDAFQAQGKITPAYPGSKIYKQLQGAKASLPASLQGLSDSELLDLLDKQHQSLHGTKGSATFKTKTADWANTPAGQKVIPGAAPALQQKPAGAPSPTPAPNPYSPPPPTPTPTQSLLSPTGIASDIQPQDIPQIIVTGEDASAIVALNFWKQGKFQVGDVIAVALDLNDIPFRMVAGDAADGLLFQRYVNGQWVTVHKAKTSSDVFQVKYNFSIATWKTPAGYKLSTVTKTAAKKVAKKAAKTAPSAPKPSPATTQQVAQNGDISGFTDAEQQFVFDLFKNPSYGYYGLYLGDDPTAIYDRIQQVREHLKAQGGKYANLTDLQIIRMLDEAGAKKVGAKNANLYENKIVDWLKTPAGAKYAQDKASGAVPSVPLGQNPLIPKKTPGKKAPGKVATPGAGEKTHYDDLPQKKKPAFTADTQGRARPKTSEPYKVLSNKEAADMQAKMLAEEPWTAKQKASLHYYTGNAYKAMNNYLRGKRAITREVADHIIEAQRGMRRSTRAIILHRGTDEEQFGLPVGAGFAELQKLVGQQFIDHGFMSTSFGGQAAFGGSVLLEFEVPAGAPMAVVKSISQFSSEDEILLAAGTRYEVIGVERISSYQTKVKVRVIVE